MPLIWRRHLLSKSERLTLTKSTLSSIHMYLMSLSSISLDIANRLEKLKLNFIGVVMWRQEDIIWLGYDL